MNALHLILVAILDTAKTGGLSQNRAEVAFHSLSPHLSVVPDEAVTAFEENVRRILDADLPLPQRLAERSDDL
jgi:hypothetical protein